MLNEDNYIIQNEITNINKKTRILEYWYWFK